MPQCHVREKSRVPCRPIRECSDSDMQMLGASASSIRTTDGDTLRLNFFIFIVSRCFCELICCFRLISLFTIIGHHGGTFYKDLLYFVVFICI